eukprot:TRINITY_DN43669_c0_g1_i1.p1 TRINITY_DN43669_c0_g1~~TRINITY_DN43669_c0_g1_i1.p1  ORF type:complete len:265 (-),score=79.89 TRINITY_DN43669_c0_g1_i1:113-859(-)
MAAAAAGLVKREASATAADERPNKTTRGKAGKGPPATGLSAEESAELVKSVARLAVTTARDVASLQAVNFVTVLIDKNTQLGELVSTKAKATTTAYTEQARSLEGKQKGMLGSPHIFTWLARVDTMKEFAETSNRKEQAAIFTQHLNDINDKTELMMKQQANSNPDKAQCMRIVTGTMVRFFRVSKCFDINRTKTQVNATPSTTGEAAVNAFVTMLVMQAAGQLRQGAPPKGEQERRVARLLDRVDEQ